MKEEALKLADEIDGFGKEADIQTSKTHGDYHRNVANMIRKLVAELDKQSGVLEQKLIDFSVRIRELEKLVTIERNKNQQAFANGCRHTMKKYGIKNESK